MSTSIIDLADSEWAQWLNEQPTANIFHHPAWSEVITVCYGYRACGLVVRDKHGKITAGLPLMAVKGLTSGQRWVSLPFTDHCAPLYSNADALAELLQQLPAQFRQQPHDHLELRWNLPDLPGGSPFTEHVLHQMNLPGDPAIARSRLHATHRRNIKTAESRGVRVEQGCSETFLRAYYHLHLLTRKRQGMPSQPWKFFRLLGNRLLERDLGFVLLAWHGETCVAGALFLKWQNTLMYKYGASDLDQSQLRANNLVMWSAIRWGCENGWSVFDLGRSDNANESLRKFKSGWGAQETPLVYTQITRQPKKENPSMLRSLVQRAIRVSPVWVSQLTGQLLYRYFG